MACHEIAALRLALMNVLGSTDEAARAHELEELGDAINKPGPVSSLAGASDLRTVAQLFTIAIVDLNETVSRTARDDAKLPYLRSLLVLTKKVELELKSQVESLERLHVDLEDMHDFVHEIFPAE